MSDTESIYSIISIDINYKDNPKSDSSESEEDNLVNELGQEMKDLDLNNLVINNLMNITQECIHEFQRNKGLDSNRCRICNWYPSKDNRAKCKKCYLEACINCIENTLKIQVEPEINNGQKYTNNQILNLRVSTLETRVNDLEQRLTILEKGKTKIAIEERDTQEAVHLEKLEAELMNLEKNDTSLICNEDKEFSTIKVLVKIKIKDVEIETLALVDPGCTSCLINKEIVPEQLLKVLERPITATQMDGSQNIYNYYIEKAQISFLNTCNKFYNPVYNVNKILARDLNIGSNFVIGLRFCIQNKEDVS